MNIKLINEGSTGELVLEGWVDSVSASDVEAVFDQSAQRFDCVILNMAKMDYITSAGLRVVKKMHMAMKKKGGELILTNVNPAAMEVFEVTGFAGLLTIR